MYNGFIVTDDMRNKKFYDGMTSKFGITIDGRDYIVKSSEDSLSKLFSEYVASRFISGLGIVCHKVWVGKHYEENVIIIKDFTDKNVTLHPYKDTRQSSEGTDMSNKTYTYKDVTHMIASHKKMSAKSKEEALDRFWDMYICDAILANRDRHHGNWGYVKLFGRVYPAPIYDNGGSLFPDVSKVIDKFSINEYKFLEERCEKFPASLFCREREDGTRKRTNYYEVLSECSFDKRLLSKMNYYQHVLNLEDIYKNIQDVVNSLGNLIPNNYKRFYIMIVCMRYCHIICRESIEESYRKVRCLIDGQL